MQWQPKQGRDGRSRRSRRRHIRWSRLLPVLAGTALLVYGLGRLIAYGVDLAASRRSNREMETIYYNRRSDTPMPEEATLVPSVTAPGSPRISATPTPTQSPIPRLDALSYPNNPGLRVASQFQTLRKENRDIVAWLKLGGLLDQAVAQRDNVYYLDHDIKGGGNRNGALFLDAAIDLKTRPYTLIVYGHNMKSGAMFGSLRNYENLAFYRRDPFITFDQLSEPGCYVIFAVGSISVEEGGGHYVDFFGLKSANIQARQAALDTILEASVFSCPLDVRPEDQWLILVTCTEKDADRRVVAARRIREGETEAGLRELVNGARKK